MTDKFSDYATADDVQPFGAPRYAGAGEMSAIDSDSVAIEAPAPSELLSGPTDPASGPVRVHGKFFFAGDRKHFIKGVTYGPFGIGSHGEQFPEIAVVEQDFALMRSAGINTLRVFTVPPLWLLDAADEAGLKVLVGLPWSQHVDRKSTRLNSSHT